MTLTTAIIILIEITVLGAPMIHMAPTTEETMATIDMTASMIAMTAGTIVITVRMAGVAGMVDTIAMGDMMVAMNLMTNTVLEAAAMIVHEEVAMTAAMTTTTIADPVEEAGTVNLTAEVAGTSTRMVELTGIIEINATRTADPGERLN